MTACRHEIDIDNITYDKRYGRIGYCKKCGCRLRYMRLNNTPKRTRVKMKKKQRVKLNRELHEKEVQDT